MKNILTEGAAVLDEVAREEMLLVFDFDGTLAPIVEQRADAAMPPSTRALLRLVSLIQPCAVVSGRSRADLMSRVGGIPLAAVVGNHGAEAGYGPLDRSLRALVDGWKPVLRARLADLPGVEIEDKWFSIAIHYRNSPSWPVARRALREVTAALPGARVFGGHAVVNVVPAEAPDKGIAVAELLPRVSRRRALYVGDDRTDETAFRSDAVAVGVRVGRTHLSAARFYLPSRGDVDALLRTLVVARRRRDGVDDDMEGLDRLIAMEA